MRTATLFSMRSPAVNAFDAFTLGFAILFSQPQRRFWLPFSPAIHLERICATTQADFRFSHEFPGDLRSSSNAGRNCEAPGTLQVQQAHRNRGNASCETHPPNNPLQAYLASPLLCPHTKSHAVHSVHLSRISRISRISRLNNNSVLSTLNYGYHVQ